MPIPLAKSTYTPAESPNPGVSQINYVDYEFFCGIANIYLVIDLASGLV
jgi:hypothetical protein